MNNVGTVGMTNLYLVSQTPGLVSFGRKKNEEGSASLYDFPLVEDSGPNFRYHREDGTIEQVAIIFLLAKNHFLPLGQIGCFTDSPF